MARCRDCNQIMPPERTSWFCADCQRKKDAKRGPYNKALGRHVKLGSGAQSLFSKSESQNDTLNILPPNLASMTNNNMSNQNGRKAPGRHPVKWNGTTFESKNALAKFIAPLVAAKSKPEELSLVASRTIRAIRNAGIKISDTAVYHALKNKPEWKGNETTDVSVSGMSIEDAIKSAF